MRVFVGGMGLAAGKGDGNREAEAVMREKGIAEIRKVEEDTKRQIKDKEEELRQLVGNRYRDLIDSADSILAMKSSCLAVSSNIASIRASILTSLSSEDSLSPPSSLPDSEFSSSNRLSIYSVACRVKYLVDTPESIWACLDESMFLESASRYIRATHVHSSLSLSSNPRILSHFPLLKHQWVLVDAFKQQISQRSRERLLDRDLPISSYADALAALAIVDRLTPTQVLSSFLHSRLSWITHIRPSSSASSDSVISFFCQSVSIILITLGLIGELFLSVLHDMPLFYKVILHYPPASQLFGGIPQPDEEVRLWKLFREELDPSMTLLEKEDVSSLCLSWLKSASLEIKANPLVSCILTGSDLACAEKTIRETLENKQVLQESIEWLRNVFGSEIELPWYRIRELVLQHDYDVWNGVYEEAFVFRMKGIITSEFDQMVKAINLRESIEGADSFSEITDFEAYISRPSSGSSVWFVDPSSKKGNSLDFSSCLTSYLGGQITAIKDSIETQCQRVLNDMLLFLESPKADQRIGALSKFLQEKCFDSLSMILQLISSELGKLREDMKQEASFRHIEKTLFIGRLLYAFKHHVTNVKLILGSPRHWTKQSSLAILTLDANSGTYLENIGKTTSELCVSAYELWTSWFSSQLSVVLSRDLLSDDALSSTTALKGWEETVVKQEESEMRISLPCMPSTYVISFIFRACEEVHRIGGHVIDKTVLQNLVRTLLQKIVDVYESHEGLNLSEKGVLQMLFDLRFSSDVLSGEKTGTFRREINQNVGVGNLIGRLSEKLDPIDWLTYEPYLWENTKQAYLRHAVLFGFFVQLNRKYTDVIQNVSANSEPNILRCSVVPRFKYLPISAPALSSSRMTKASLITSDDLSTTAWKKSVVSDGMRSEADDSSSFGVAAPIFKSFMQVGSKFGILSEGQVGNLKERSGNVISTFGDILPSQAAGLLSSFTQNKTDL